jgi:hypothetical protein
MLLWSSDTETAGNTPWAAFDKDLQPFESFDLDCVYLDLMAMPLHMRGSREVPILLGADACLKLFS